MKAKAPATAAAATAEPEKKAEESKGPRKFISNKGPASGAPRTEEPTTMMGRAGFGGAKPEEQKGRDFGPKKSEGFGGGFSRGGQTSGDSKPPTFKKQEPKKEEEGGWNFSSGRKK